MKKIRRRKGNSLSRLNDILQDMSKKAFQDCFGDRFLHFCAKLGGVL